MDDLFDTLLAARGAIAQWVVAHPFDMTDPTGPGNAQRKEMTDAEEALSQALLTIEDIDLDAALENMEADAQTLRDDAANITGMASSLDEVASVVSSVSSIVDILTKVAANVDA